ncbi:hypothetical protein SAMD00019534_117080 [Acytostelium subglobosum LB1]|uniref:hypothetical protein n=1 Tax=Acytostelium subglobosum LB1 TaxID=1410327 RepID=UPI000644CFD7|nr:hypothetical protein SAMD00019534_117080 [Acytostelium subglobosum LB1]GAM28532.1 hypothetical protein SAMD00019534_117080 [Acytostelium subglobosum LB1]|eukprot:XP_012748571.1 hypothetical protein SAMD00019534_117080 [Acytostelium subglobosum LB1]
MDELNKGNSFFVDENFEQALIHYNKACEQMTNNFEAFFKRAQCHQKLECLNDALHDINTCIKLEPNNPKSYLKKGQFCFELEEYDTALSVFEKGLSLEPESTQFRTWIRKAKAELGTDNLTATPAAAPAAAPISTTTPVVTQTTTPAATTAPAAPVAAAKPPAATTTPTPTPAPTSLPIPSSGTKVKHEWYQTATHVTLTVYAKFVTAANSTIDLQDKSISISFMMATGSEYSLDIEFFDPIVPADSTTKYYSTKVEIVLKKSRAIRWENLEYTGVDRPVGTVDTPQPKPAGVPSPYSSNKNWDAIDAGDDKEGDPLNRVFQDIFSRGSEEQRRAMQKSFLESGGTVLSTNWQDVGKKTVKGAPPKGMEMHSWNNGEKVEVKEKESWEKDD